MNFPCHRRIAFILIDRYVLQKACIFDVNLMTLKICFLRNCSVAKSLRRNNVVELSCTFQT